MSRQEAVCAVLADSRCIPSFFTGQGSAMMHPCNQVIGDIKETEKYCRVVLNQTEVEHGKSTFFCCFFLMLFLGDICQSEIETRSQWKELENA